MKPIFGSQEPLRRFGLGFGVAACACLMVFVVNASAQSPAPAKPAPAPAPAKTTSAPSCPTASGAQTFATAQQAADALIEAAKDFDVPRIEKIFGPGGDDIVLTGETGQDR